MTIAYVTGTSKVSDNSTSVTTTGIDTTGCNFLAVIGAFNNATPTFSDSKSNTWSTAGTHHDATNSVLLQLWYCAAPTVGSGHTFQLTTDVTAWPCLAVAGYSGVNATPSDGSETFDSGYDGTPRTSAQAGTVTPSVDGDVVIAGLACFFNAVSPAIDGVYTLRQHADGGGNQLAAIADSIQTTATATNPTWSWTTSVIGFPVLHAFKAATGSASPYLIRGRSIL